MKKDNFYYYIIDQQTLKSEFLINEFYKTQQSNNKSNIISVVAPTDVNQEELNISSEEIILQIEEDAFVNCKKLNKLILPNTIKYIGNNSFPIQTKIIVDDEEFSVNEYKKYIEHKNALELISELKLVLPCIKEIDKIINLIKKSKTSLEAETTLSTFFHNTIKMNNQDSKKAASLILSLKLQVIASFNYEKIKQQISQLEIKVISN